MGHGTTIELVLKEEEISLYPPLLSSSLRNSSSNRQCHPLRRSFQAMTSLSSSLIENQSCSSLKEESTEPTPATERSGRAMNDQITIVQAILFLILASQLPYFREEVREVIELHYHGFSSTIMFCLFRSVFRFNKSAHVRRRESCARQNSVCSQASLMMTGGKSLCGVEGSYHSDDCPSRTRVALAEDDDDPLDEWGHFTDFDESFHDEFMVASLKTREFSTLHEIDEED